MTHDENKTLALFCASRIFPSLLNNRMGKDVGLTQAEALSYLTHIVDRNSYTKPEVVLGCAFSSLTKLHTSMVHHDGVVTWVRIKDLMEAEFHTLRKTDRAWNEYYRFFYELITTYIAQWVAVFVLKKFCVYLRFDGSIAFSDDEIRAYLYRAGIGGDFETLRTFMHRDDNYTMLPESYRSKIVAQTAHRIYDLTQGPDSHFRGTPEDLLTILKDTYDTVMQIPANLPYEQLSHKYPHADTRSNPVQASVDALLSGMLRDIRDKTFNLASLKAA